MEDTIRRWLFDPVIGRLLTVVLGALVIAVLARVARASAGKYIADVDMRYRARKFITFLGYVAALILLATVFAGRFTGVTVALGVAGAGVAFALQEVIASLAGWIAMLFGSFYEPGDRVQLNGRIVRIANSFVFKEPVFNSSADFPFLWDEIKVPARRMARHPHPGHPVPASRAALGGPGHRRVDRRGAIPARGPRDRSAVLLRPAGAMVLATHVLNFSATAKERGLILHTGVTIGYDAPWRQVHELLLSAARETPGILKDPVPFVLQTSLDDFYVSYELNAFTDQPGIMARTYSELHSRIQDKFNEEGVEIMSPHYRAAPRQPGHDSCVLPEGRLPGTVLPGGTNRSVP